MTREKALQVSRALNDVDDFSLFMEEIEKIMVDFSLGDFEKKLGGFLMEEYIRRKNILENL